jgi:SAM-dependent methyltransferase
MANSNSDKKFDDKNYWKNRHSSVDTIKASGLKSVSVKANHYIYRILTEQYAKLLSKLDLKDVKTILDCGFGDGHFLQFFVENYSDKKLTGVDISQAAKEKIDFVPKKQLHVADLATLNLDKKFDLVHCFDVLYHVLDENDYRSSLENIAKHSNNYVILHEKFVRKSPRFSSAHVRFRRREYTNQILNSKGFYLHSEIPTHFLGVRFFSYRLNKLIPGILYKVDKYIADHFPEHLQEVLGTHTIRVYKKSSETS